MISASGHIRTRIWQILMVPGIDKNTFDNFQIPSLPGPYGPRKVLENFYKAFQEFSGRGMRGP